MTTSKVFSLSSIIQIQKHSKPPMAQKMSKDEAHPLDYIQAARKQHAGKEVSETPSKNHLNSSNQGIFTDLSPLPMPHKNENCNIYIYGSTEIREICTPIAFPRENSRFMPNQDHQPIITTKLIFQSQHQVQNESSYSESQEDEEQSSQQSSNSRSKLSRSQLRSSQQRNLGQPLQEYGNANENEEKINFRRSKSRKCNQTSKQLESSRKVLCNCIKSKCLKLYCDCFRMKLTCEGCNCIGCHNTQGHDEERKNAILALMDRNPDPFSQKIEADMHIKGCNCKKSNCLKKYCECFQAGLKCGSNCKCQECKNTPFLKSFEDDQRETINNTAKKQRKMVQM